MYEGYNYGVSASGPHQMLSFLVNKKLKIQLKQDRGIAVYVFINSHIERSNGFALQRSLHTGQPFYKFINNKLEYLGSFEDAEPLKSFMYKLLLKYARRLKYFNINFPKRTENHLLNTCEIISRSRDIFEKKFPNSKFVVYRHPMSEMDGSLKRCLEAKNVSLILPKALHGKELKNHHFSLDNHPNSFHNIQYGRKLSQWLERYRVQ